jgi:NOL1/NOP2/fmu family ribosome biogenesis protein
MTGGIIERRFDVERGFVVVKYGEDVLGCGLYDGERLISRIPKAKRIDERWMFREG